MIEQPAPIPNDNPPSWDFVIEDLERWSDEPTLAALVIADARERDGVGRERYGCPLQAGNGRDSIRDAYDEYLDGTVYLRTAMIEADARGDTKSYGGLLALLYTQSLAMTIRLRGILKWRDGR